MLSSLFVVVHSKRRCRCSFFVHFKLLTLMVMMMIVLVYNSYELFLLRFGSSNIMIKTSTTNSWLVLYADAASAVAGISKSITTDINTENYYYEKEDYLRNEDSFVHDDNHHDSSTSRRTTIPATIISSTDILDDNNVETTINGSGTEEVKVSTNNDSDDNDTITSNIYNVPVYTKQDLLQLLSSTTATTSNIRNDLYDNLSPIGLISIKVDDADVSLYDNARRIGLSSFMKCVTGGISSSTTNNDDNDDKTTFPSSSLFHTVIGSSDHGGLLVSSEHEQQQKQHMISRSTLATAIIGDTPLSLPTQKEFQIECSHRNNNDNSYDNVIDHMESIRDIVTDISDAFINTLDNIIGVGGDNGRCSSHRCHEQPQPLMKSITGEIYPSIRSIVKSATHLEHFHVYHHHDTMNITIDDRQKQKHYRTSSSYDTNNNNITNMILDVHTDAGLFLSFVPGLSCRNNNKHMIVEGTDNNEQQVNSESSFTCDDDDNNSDLYVMINGVLHKAIFPKHTIGIMVGIGLQNWLSISYHKNNNNIQFTATKHAVYMPSGYTRGWYGRMYLVPPQAIIQGHPIPRTFADMRQAMVVTNHNVRTRQYSDLLEGTGLHNNETMTAESHISIGCGSNEAYHDRRFDTNIMFDNNNNNIEARSRVKERRRLTMVPDASACNNSTNFYCWMSCLDIPDYSRSGKYIDDGQSLYCADPKTLVTQSDIVSATKPCNDYTSNGVIIGGAMNTNCVGIWQPTASGIPATPVIPSNNSNNSNNNDTNNDNTNESTVQESFCLSGTSMYMDGFHWLHPVCVIYLFPSWILSTSGKLIGAAFGTIVFGIMLEGVIHQRRYYISNMSIGWTRLSLSTIIYGLQLTMGYMIMLVVMTYSGPLFLSVIIGLMGGHFIFNSYDVYQSYQLSKNKDNDHDTNSVSDNDNDDNNNGSSRMIAVPEGCTPCCQNAT